MSDLTYTIVIATRNRPGALRLSIPRMLGQDCPPSQMIVVDSSDDHAATVAAVRESLSCASQRNGPPGAVGPTAHQIDLRIIRSERGLTRQRNASLEHIEHPVVFFPDDDSIWYPRVAAEQLAVYQRDGEQRVAAVCGAEASSPPPGWTAGQAYQMRPSHRLQQRVASLRAKVEGWLFPDPARVLGRSFFPPAGELPGWFADHDVVPVEWMTGFRMSFRTKVIQAVGFDEVLSRYSLFEDIDASFGAWRHGWVVGARRARIFHYRSPERRDHGRRLGAEQLVNKAYLIAKHSPPGHPARRAMAGFARFKALQYRLGARGTFGCDRYAGARAARPEATRLARARPCDVEVTYKVAMQRSMRGG